MREVMGKSLSKTTKSAIQKFSVITAGRASNAVEAEAHAAKCDEMN
jgi:hypothetical protein